MSNWVDGTDVTEMYVHTVTLCSPISPREIRSVLTPTNVLDTSNLSVHRLLGHFKFHRTTRYASSLIKKEYWTFKKGDYLLLKAEERI